jgi:phospho-N-acetylmuramoyl-pentapeptide-transferase
LGVLLAIFIYHYPANAGGRVETVLNNARSLNWPFLPMSLVLPAWIFAALTVVVITGSSNAVNLTDGMDGLAAGCMTIVSFAFMVLAYVTGDSRWAMRLEFNWIPQTSELAFVGGALTGACLGFLWYNCNPAQVFMGDTGSLALGGVIGYVAIVIRQEPMLLLVGGIFVLEASSVIIQVTYFRCTGGKKLFLCSPIHHHFHLSGWSEQQVVVRFWLISAMCAAFGLATVKMR